MNSVANPVSLRMLGLAVLLCGFFVASADALAATVSTGPVAAAASAVSPAASGPAPKARPATNLRSDHYRRREACNKQADAQNLQGEARKTFVYQCLTQ